VYAHNPHDLEVLKYNIHEAVYNIQQCEFQQVSRNVFERIQACLAAKGSILNIFYGGEYSIVRTQKRSQNLGKKCKFEVTYNLLNFNIVSIAYSLCCCIK
jgi:hypothetical protein